MELLGQEHQIAAEPSQLPAAQEQPAEGAENSAGGAASVGEAQRDAALVEQEQKEKAAAEAKAALAKKKAERRADLAAVTKAVSELDDFPGAARSTLLAGLPHAFGTAEGDGRHIMQSNFIQLITKALESGRDHAKTGAEEARTAAEEVEKELQVCETELAEKVEAAKAAKALGDEKIAASVQAFKQAREAESEHKITERKGQSAAKVRKQIREERERVAAVAEGSLQMLAGGGWEDEETKAAALRAVQKHMDRADMDKLLKEVAPRALQLSPAKRARFDTTIVDQVTKLVNTGLAALNEQVEKIALEEADAKAELLGSWAIAEVARERADAAKKAQLDAQAELTTARAGVARAEEKVGEQKKNVSFFASQQAVFDAKADEVMNASLAVSRLQSVH